MNNKKKCAYVIMPFTEDHKLLYENFIKIVLEEEGFNVDIAYASQNSRSILQDIITSLYKCDLVIADLTDLNPNVLYELGIAHTFEKDTILLTQNIDELPFDLYIYRVIEYNPHFVRIKKAWEEFRKFVKGAIDGKTLFGNPVIDAMKFIEEVPKETKKAETSKEVSKVKSSIKQEGGFLIDHLIKWEEGIKSITGIALNITKATKNIGDKTKEITIKVNNLNISKISHSAKLMLAKSLMTDFSEELTEYNEVILRNNNDYSKINSEIENSLEFIVEYQDPSKDIEKAKDEIKKLINFENSVENGSSSMSRFRDSILKIPRLEVNINNSIIQTSEVLTNLINNMNRTLSQVKRAREILELKISNIKN